MKRKITTITLIALGIIAAVLSTYFAFNKNLSENVYSGPLKRPTYKREHKPIFKREHKPRYESSKPKAYRYSNDVDEGDQTFLIYGIAIISGVCFLTTAALLMKKNYNKMKFIIRLVLAGILIGCLAKMSYGYFQFVRVASCALFLWLAYLEYKDKRKITTVLCVCAALLLNPITKVHFTRIVWNKIDVAIAILLIAWILIELTLHFLSNKKYG